MMPIAESNIKEEKKTKIAKSLICSIGPEENQEKEPKETIKEEDKVKKQEEPPKENNDDENLDEPSDTFSQNPQDEDVS